MMTRLCVAALAVAAAWAVSLAALAAALTAAAAADRDTTFDPDEHTWELLGDEWAHATDCWCGWYVQRPTRRRVGL